MKNMTLSLLAAAAISTISIGSVSAMPVNNLAGLGESHFQDVRRLRPFWAMLQHAARLSLISLRAALLRWSWLLLWLWAWLLFWLWSWLRILRRTACRNWCRPGRLRCLVTHSHLATI